MTKDIFARCSSAYSISQPSQVLGAKFAYIILWGYTGSCPAFHKVNNNGTSSLHLSPRSPPYRLEGQNHFQSSLSQLPACTPSPYLPLRSALPPLLSLSLSVVGEGVKHGSNLDHGVCAPLVDGGDGGGGEPAVLGRAAGLGLAAHHAQVGGLLLLHVQRGSGWVETRGCAVLWPHCNLHLVVLDREWGSVLRFFFCTYCPFWSIETDILVSICVDPARLL